MEKLDKERYLKRVIVVCWIALAICFGIKLFGGNLFEIICENENFIKVCEYADNHFWAKYIIGFINTSFGMYFLLLAMCQRWKYEKWELIVSMSTIAINTAVKILFTPLGLVLDIWQGIIMPMIFKGRGKKQCLFVVLGNVMLLIFQVVSMFVKNVSLGFITNNGILISFIFSIDVNLMIILYYLYSNLIKKGKEK